MGASHENCYEVGASLDAIREVICDRRGKRRQTVINFCNACGKRVIPDSVFCSYCGKKLR